MVVSFQMAFSEVFSVSSPSPYSLLYPALSPLTPFNPSCFVVLHFHQVVCVLLVFLWTTLIDFQVLNQSCILKVNSTMSCGINLLKSFKIRLLISC